MNLTKNKKIALGTVQFGLSYGISNKLGKPSHSEVEKIINCAYESGIHTLDTAQAYGNSESVLSDLHSNRFDLISKFIIDDSFKSVAQCLTKSQETLKVDSLSGYMVHNIEGLFANEDIWNELIHQKQIGKVKQIGVSIYHVEEFEKLLKIGIIPDIIQLPYNILDRRFDLVFPKMKSLGIKIHSRSSFLQGLLFVKSEELPPFFNPLIPWIKVFERELPLLEDKISYLLSFCIENHFIDKVVLGVNSLEELLLNLDATDRNQKQVFFDPPFIDKDILLPYNWPNSK